MNHELELKLKAWVDGQLPVHEADAVARLIETDAAARAVLTELRNTRSALAGFEDGIKLPESREFYWSKIARAIEREQPKARPAAPTPNGNTVSPSGSTNRKPPPRTSS